MAVLLSRYFNPGRSPIFYCSVLFLSIVIFFASQFAEMGYKSFHLNFIINTKQNADFAIYYDVGRGLTEQDRQSQKIETINEDIELSFCLPVYHRLKLLRFDPATEHVEMTVKRISYSYDSGKAHTIPLDQVKPLFQIKSYALVDNMLHFTTAADGNDPNFVIESDLSPPQKTKADNIFSYLGSFLLALFTALFLRFMYLFFIEDCNLFFIVEDKQYVEIT